MDGGAGLNAKRLQILKEIVPTAMRIAFVTSRRQEVEALGVPILERLLADVTEAELGRALDEMVRRRSMPYSYRRAATSSHSGP